LVNEHSLFRTPSAKQFFSFHQFGHPARPPVSSWDKIGQTSENPERQGKFSHGRIDGALSANFVPETGPCWPGHKPKITSYT
jgi:hypothetical protein